MKMIWPPHKSKYPDLFFSHIEFKAFDYNVFVFIEAENMLPLKDGCGEEEKILYHNGGKKIDNVYPLHPLQ